MQEGSFKLTNKYIKVTLENGEKLSIIYDYNKNISKLVSIGSSFPKISDKYDYDIDSLK